MISQQDLAEVLADRAQLARLEQTPAVRDYLATQERLTKGLEALGKRAAAGEPVRPGNLRLCVTRSAVVLWGALWKALARTAAVFAAVTDDPEAQEIMQRAHALDVSAPYVREQIAVDVRLADLI